MPRALLVYSVLLNCQLGSTFIKKLTMLNRTRSDVSVCDDPLASATGLLATNQSLAASIVTLVLKSALLGSDTRRMELATRSI